MKKILAVSGGVDSMVLLDICARRFPAEELVVATFDHKTRESSRVDADFVERRVGEINAELSRNQPALQIRFYRGEIGRGVDFSESLGGDFREGIKEPLRGSEGGFLRLSEEEARRERYRFLREVAFSEKGEILTAHHLDDLVETVAINCLRGTGVRGLAPFANPGVRRPFLDGMLEPREFGLPAFDRRGILKYAAENVVVFRQDPTNTSAEFLRNRVREKTFVMPTEEKLEIFELWQKQRKIVREMDGIVESLIPEDLKFERGFYHKLNKKTSLEIIRGALMRAGITATRPQMEDFLDAILHYESGKKFNLPGDRLVKIGKHDFQLRIA